jgi:hypothetical protein
LNDRFKKYLKLSTDEGFDEKQRAMFGLIAIKASKQLEMLKAQWEYAAPQAPQMPSIP